VELATIFWWRYNGINVEKCVIELAGPHITVIQYIVGEISCNYIPDIHRCLNCILIPHCNLHPRILIFSMRLETYGTCFPVMVPLFSSPRWNVPYIYKSELTDVLFQYCLCNTIIHLSIEKYHTAVVVSSV
jgi:hypothetical protein